MIKKPWVQGHGMDTATCVLCVCVCPCYTLSPRLKKQSCVCFSGTVTGESNSNSHARLYFNHDNKPPLLSADTCVRKICHPQQKTVNIWVWSVCMLMCIAQSAWVVLGECFVLFFYGGTTDRGIIFLGVLPVFCAVIEEKHTLLWQQ